MEIWAKKKKDHNREYRTAYKVVSVRYEEAEYIYVCESPAVIRDLKIRYKFVDCEKPIKEKKVVVEQPIKEQVEQPKPKRKRRK